MLASARSTMRSSVPCRSPTRVPRALDIQVDPQTRWHRPTRLSSGTGPGRPSWHSFHLLTERRVRYAAALGNRGSHAMSKPSDLVQGTLDLLILKILAL